MALAEANDLQDERGLGAKVGWLVTATARLVVSAVVVVGFLVSLLLLTNRFQADQALAGGQAHGFAALAEQGGGLGISAAGSSEEMAAARGAQQAFGEWKARESLAAERMARRDATGEALRLLAARGGCAAANVDEALRCTLAETADPTLRVEYQQKRALYVTQHEEYLATAADVPALARLYDVEAMKPGASYQAALPAIMARDNVLNSMPAFLRPAALWFFELPLLVSSVAVAFLGGMFGAVMVLLVLLAFPSYAPLTFGGGKYFFLRMFTGGFIATLLFVAFQSGITVAGLGDLRAAAGESGASDPAKIALLGVFAGAFSEQLAGAVKGYVDRTIGGFTGGNNPMAEDPAVTPPAPPEGGPRPAI